MGLAGASAQVMLTTTVTIDSVQLNPDGDGSGYDVIASGEGRDLNEGDTVIGEAYLQASVNWLMLTGSAATDFQQSAIPASAVQ